METRIVDERDTRWEATVSRYRVEVRSDDGSRTTYELSDGAVEDVLFWVAENGGDALSIAAVLSTSEGLGVVYLTPPLG